MCRQYSNEHGHGHASLTRWRSKQKIPRIEGQINLQCTKFTYGGYGGNLNNFKSKRECETWCLCPVAKCDKECDYGYTFDDSGCPTCECLGHPCAVRIALRHTVRMLETYLEGWIVAPRVGGCNLVIVVIFISTCKIPVVRS